MSHYRIRVGDPRSRTFVKQRVLTTKKFNFTNSALGHIAFSALDDTSHSVHVFSINGTHLGSKYVSGRVTGLTTANDNLIVADDAGDITMSRLYG